MASNEPSDFKRMLNDFKGEVFKIPLFYRICYMAFFTLVMMVIAWEFIGIMFYAIAFVVWLYVSKRGWT